MKTSVLSLLKHIHNIETNDVNNIDYLPKAHSCSGTPCVLALMWMFFDSKYPTQTEQCSTYQIWSKTGQIVKQGAIDVRWGEGRKKSYCRTIHLENECCF